MVAKLTKLDGTIITYPIARIHRDDTNNRLMLALKDPQVYEKPEKTLYNINIYEDNSETIIFSSLAVFESYNIIIDNSIEINGSKPTSYIQNMLNFISV